MQGFSSPCILDISLQFVRSIGYLYFRAVSSAGLSNWKTGKLGTLEILTRHRLIGKEAIVEEVLEKLRGMARLLTSIA